jgi:hypothetical protein
MDDYVHVPDTVMAAPGWTVQHEEKKSGKCNDIGWSMSLLEVVRNSKGDIVDGGHWLASIHFPSQVLLPHDPVLANICGEIDYRYTKYIQFGFDDGNFTSLCIKIRNITHYIKNVVARGG